MRFDFLFGENNKFISEPLICILDYCSTAFSANQSGTTKGTSSVVKSGTSSHIKCDHTCNQKCIHGVTTSNTTQTTIQAKLYMCRKNERRNEKDCWTDSETNGIMKERMMNERVNIQMMKERTMFRTTKNKRIFQNCRNTIILFLICKKNLD